MVEFHHVWHGLDVANYVEIEEIHDYHVSHLYPTHAHAKIMVAIVHLKTLNS